MDLRQKIMAATDRVLAAALVVLVLGSVLAFGGAVWWFPPAVVGLTFLMVAVGSCSVLVQGRMPLLKSPLTLLGLLALALGMVQLLPLPAGLARRVSPVAHEVYSSGTWSRLVHADDPEASVTGRRRPIAGDARPGRDPALACGRRRLPGDLLDRLSLRRSAATGSTGSGERGGGLPAQRRAGGRPDRRSSGGALRFRLAGARTGLGTHARRSARVARARRLATPGEPATRGSGRAREGRPRSRSPVPVRDDDGRSRGAAGDGLDGACPWGWRSCSTCWPRAGAARAWASGWATRAWAGLPS